MDGLNFSLLFVMSGWGSYCCWRCRFDGVCRQNHMKFFKSPFCALLRVRVCVCVCGLFNVILPKKSSKLFSTFHLNLLTSLQTSGI